MIDNSTTLRDRTALVVTADHETGGLSLARDGIYAWNPRDLRLLDATPALMAETYVGGDATLSAVFAAHSQKYTWFSRGKRSRSA